MAKVVIFGTEKFAELCLFYLRHDSPHQVVAFTVDRPYLKAPTFQGLPVAPFEEIENKYPPGDFEMLIAVGFRKLNSIRARKYEEAKKKGYRLISYVSSKATHWGDTKLGDNCVILENQVIQPTVTIGNDVVLWSGNHFGHNVVIEDHVWISSHAVLSGGVRIGERSFVGVNVTIRDQVRVGRECILGAGALILRDAGDKEVYIAKPTELFKLNSTDFERMMDISR